MSLLDRLNLLIRSELNDVVRPDRLRSAVSEMETSLRDARRQNAELRVAEKRLIERIRDSRAKATTWEDRAVLALKSGQEDLAREALVMKNKAERELEGLRDDLDEQRAYIKDMERALEALDHKVRGARGKGSSGPDSKTQGSESAWDAEFRRRMGGREVDESQDSGPSRSFHPSTDRSFQEFDRMSDKIRDLEANVDAMGELADEDPLIDPKRKKLEDNFRKLEETKRTNDDLADLKKKFSE